MIELFCRYVAKVQEGSDFSSNKYRIVNKCLIKHVMHFCNECQKDRNEYDCNKRSKEKELCNGVKMYRHMNEKELPQVKIFPKQVEVDLRRCSAKIMLKQVYEVKEMTKKVEKLLKGDIRWFFEMQNKDIK